VPSFAAVQAWAGAERRARTVAAVNVLSAGAIVTGALIIASLQRAGLGAPDLFGLLGAASLLVAVLMLAVGLDRRPLLLRHRRAAAEARDVRRDHRA
jgi:acyl-[acyl-carrier-protein]-phospholipid O-acyltransferase/long-chain-fatty-acid--[acyl-carrier-protein] ligase